MKEKTRKILIMAVMAALIISLMAASLCYAFTYGRYTGGRLDDNSTYDDLIDFVGATAFTVTSPEEFVNAIENGYSYIKIGEGAEDPFVINEDIADVYTNLVLDVNGTTVIRNSRNPVLDVRRSISVVLVYDSSEGATGGFYNPVGSALQTSGGSLTIGSGSYMSGPNSTVNASLPGSQSVSLVTLYTRTSRTAGSYGTKVENISMPSLSGDVYYTGDTTQYTYIKNDTYLIYTEEKNAFVSDGQLYVNAKSTTTGEGGNQTTTVTGTQLTPICNVASCDFYYYYPIDENGAYSEEPGTVDSPKTYAVVYGYNDVKGLAETEDTPLTEYEGGTNLAWPYAAIRSVKDGTVGGVTHARGGTFTTNFGTDNTYGIYSVGGTMTVGTDSASTPPEFTATGEGTCIRMSAGEGDTLTIASGNFSSRVGDTILMSGGEMTVTGGTFEKNASSGGQSTGIAANGSAIRVEGGTLNINGTQTGNTKSVTFTITGSNVNGITSPEVTGTPGIVNVTNASFTFNSGSSGTMNYGIAAAGGTVSATSCTFAIPGNDNNGIVVSGGQITASSSTFTLNGDRNNGIYSNITNSTTEENKYDTTAQSCTFNMTGSSSFGVHSEGGKTLVQGGTITMTGTNSSGVYSEGGTVTLRGENAPSSMSISVDDERNGNILSCTAVSTVGGNINVDGVVYLYSNSLGITAQGNDNATGNITVEEGAVVYVGESNSPLPATAIYVNGGSISIGTGAEVNVYSTINANYNWNTTVANFNKFNGIYVQGGSLTSTGTLNVTFTGVENESQYNGPDDLNLTIDTGNDTSEANYNNAMQVVEANSNLFANFQTKSYAVRVEGDTDTEVKIAKGKITNDIGGGVLVNGGKVTLGTEENSGDLTVSTTGDDPINGTTYWNAYIEEYKNILGQTRYRYYVVETDYVPIAGAAGNWGYEESATGGDAVKVVDGELTIEGGTYSAAHGNGILVSNGKATVNGGTFMGGDERNANTTSFYTGAGSNYGLKVLGGYATVEGGTFSSNGGGVFIMGTETNNQQTTITAATIEVSGATAVSLWDYANVVFGTLNAANNNLTVKGASTGLAVEITSSSDARQTIVINSGKFTGQGSGNDQNGIWYGNPATMTINGGEFTGGTSGLFFQVNQWNNAENKGNVQIYSGTFIGGTNSIGGRNADGVDLGYEIQITDFIDYSAGKYIDYYNYSDTTDSLDRSVSLSSYDGADRNSQNLNATTELYRKIIIR